ncbi:hypothetical protein BYT27DRAFT_7342686 [Phlegmacium glaucopus]|nr:hypothetical protein BYT27DRAFT_7342686 [Phlegmacium glaucopus]
MSDDDTNTPLNFPSSEADYYSEFEDMQTEETSASLQKSPRKWEPEILQIITEAGFSPEDIETEVSLDEDSESEEEKDVNEEGETTTHQPVQFRRAGNFKIRLLAPKPPSTASAASMLVAEKPWSRQDVSVDSKKYTPATRVRPSTAVLRRVKTVHGPLKHGREYSSFESCRVGIRHRETVPVNRPGRGRLAALTGRDDEKQPPPVPKKRGQPCKPVEKASKPVSVAGSQPFNASVFISVEKPPQLMCGKTHKTDKHVTQEPCVEGPFTLIRSMKWADFLDEDETRWGKKISLDDKLAPIIIQLETLYAVGQCSDHPDIHCFYTSVHPNETWHFELNKARMAVWANVIKRSFDYQRAPIGCNFFGAKDRIKTALQAQVVLQTPPPPHGSGNSFVPPTHHTYPWPLFYPGSQHGVHPSPNLMSPSPGFHYPPSPYYPFSTPFGFGSPLPWDYPAAPPQMPGPKIIPPMTNMPQILPSPGLPLVPVPVNPTLFPATQDLKAWCMQHTLGEAEYEGLLKLGFRVGDGHVLANLETSMWEWAGIAPLAQMRILTACQATSSSGSN